MSEVQVVTYKGKKYTVRKLACGYIWHLAEVSNPNNGFTKTYEQMVNSGLAEYCEVENENSGTAKA